VTDASTGVVAGKARETSAGMAGIAGGERETRSGRYSTVLHYYFTTTKVQADATHKLHAAERGRQGERGREGENHIDTPKKCMRP
jgi:hypothetical protein